MYSLYDVNGLVMWTSDELRLRRQFTDNLVAAVTKALFQTNPAWTIVEIEAPLLMPRSLINPNYTNEDIFVQESATPTDAQLVLRPETTPGSYAAARMLFDTHTGTKPPLCVWQMGKSFRREQDQPSKHMRLKEFYQLEFQCIYTDDTMNDYHGALLEPVRKSIEDILALPTRIVDSDRLPSYSEITKDVEAWNSDKWMEIASISRRNDFPGTFTFSGKKGNVERGLKVAECAVGMDRILYNYFERINGAAHSASRPPFWADDGVDQTD